MRRPLADKRLIGPFAQKSATSTILLTADFDVEEDATQVSRDKLLERSTADFSRLVSKAADDYFNGEVVDVRIEDHAIEGGKKGIRVVYDTRTNVVFKDKIDNFEDDIEFARGLPGYMEKLAVGNQN